MTYWADDQNANRVARDQWLNPAAPEMGGAGVLQGSLTAPFRGVKQAWDQGAVALADASLPALRPIAESADDIFGSNSAKWLEGQRSVALDALRSSRITPNETGVVGQVLYGASSIVSKAAIGGAVAGPAGAAFLAGGLEGYGDYLQKRDEGVDPETAAKVGVVTGLTTAIGVGLPLSVGNSLLTTAGWGVATNVPLGMAQRYATGEVLAEKYPEMASHYKALDALAITTDVVLGAALPLASRFVRRGGAAVEPRPSEVDAAHVGAEIVHVERDVSPGLHKTPDSLNAHVEAVQRAEEQLFVENRPVERVDVADVAARMEMEPTPAHIEEVLALADRVRQTTPAELRTEIERVAKAMEQPEVAPVPKAEPVAEFPKVEPIEPAPVEGGAKAEPVKEATTVADAEQPGRPVADTLADRMFESIKAGETVADGKASPFLQVGEAIYRRGGFKEPEQFRQFVRDMAALRDKGLRGAEYQDAVAKVVEKYEPKATAGLDYSDNAKLAQADNVPPMEEAMARQVLEANPEMMIPDDDGNLISAKEALAKADMEIQQAKQDARLHDVAVACFLIHGGE